ncbi:hypothetical protein MKW98_016137 [Papaver atlanticum]|uniref:Uncharacterized protein n=1 Tax=Papaver atlanticum TaxID=357466 RepID=A0AAD4XRV2_9MAGN|nr:hypothetical protein MKW98_016137 [Papaver atlanticum]
MEDDKKTSKVPNKTPDEEGNGESTTIGCLFKHPRNKSEEVSDKDDEGYLRELKLKKTQAKQDYYAKLKIYEEAKEIYMEAKSSITEMDAKHKIYMEADKECTESLLKYLEAQKEKEDGETTIIDRLSKYQRNLWEDKDDDYGYSLVPLRMKAKEHQANQQRLMVEIAFAASNANLTNDAIAEIAIATSNANLTKDVIASKEKLLRQRRAELKNYVG